MSTLDLRQGHPSDDAHGFLALATDFPDGQDQHGAHACVAAGDLNLPQATCRSEPTRRTPAGTKPGPDHTARDAQHRAVRATQIPADQAQYATHELLVGGAQTAPRAKLCSTPNGRTPEGHQTDRGHTPTDTHGRDAPVTSTPAGQTWSDTQGRPAGGGPLLLDPLLALAAEMVDDLERTRIAAENRLRQLTRDEPDSDGIMRGFALGDREAAPYAAMVEQLAKVEHAAVLELQRRMRKHPLGPWVKAQVGIGEKQAARLIAAIGDPYWNDLHERPRTVSELWAFAGYHVVPAGQRPPDTQSGPAGGARLGSDTGHFTFGTQPVDAGVAAARRRGQRANWSATAKMRTFLIAESCIKQRHSPYRAVYDTGREKYAEALHPAPCVRCGPAGKPAAAGSPLSDGHKHARALRLVAKAILRDLWAAARDLHEVAP